MNPVVIPAADPTGLPAPVWLLQGLQVFTFILHLLPMNLILGGGLATAWAAWRGKALAARGDARSRYYEELAVRVVKLLPVATAFTITLGIAPLLFLQVLYGQLFYTSSVLMAWVWLAVIGLLMIGYYGYYGVLHSKEVLSLRTALLSFGSAVVFLVVGFIFTNNLTLMARPEKWSGMYAANPHGTHWNLDDPTLWPRYFHSVVASVAFTGVFLAILGLIQNRKDPAAGEFTSGLGARLFGASTLVQLAVGLWFLFALPERVRSAFLGGSLADTLLLWVSVAVALAAMPLMRRKPLWGTAAITLTIAGMAIVRQRVLTLTLAPHWSAASLEVAPQTAVFLIFVALLLAGLSLVGWMIWKFVGGRGEAAALVTAKDAKAA